MIDFHCHLDLYPNPHEVIAECRKRGTYVLAVTTTPRAWEGNQALLQGASRIRVAPGLHPELIPDRHSELPLLIKLIEKSRYVGEVGIDGGPNVKPHLPLQDSVFRRILAACADRGGRVLSIHSRGAASAVLDAIEGVPGNGIPVLHWFSGSQGELDRAIALGCWFSIGPAMMKSRKGARLAERMPRDRVVTETDAPFVQDRGRPLSPWDAEHALPLIALQWGMTSAAAQSQIMANFRSLTEKARSFSVAD